MITIRKDGHVVAEVETENLAFEWLLGHQGQSVEYAVRHGGYRVTDEAGSDVMALLGPTPWLAPKPANQTRVVQDHMNGGLWQAQYYDAPMALWFDIGDAKADKASAEANRQDYLR